MKRVYLDNASTTPLLSEVVDMMTEVIRNHHGNPSSIHFFGRDARSLVEDARKTVASILRCSIGEIFFTSSATEANNTILKNAVMYNGITRIISSPTEHHCVLHTLEHLAEHHLVEVIYLEVDRKGNPNLDQLESLLSNDKNHTLVSLMYVNNEIGTMLDLQRAADICNSYSVPIHCDAVQAVGKLPIDLSKLNLSYLTASAHKFHGPKGIGFFYMNMDHIIPPYIHGGAQERNMRAGTENTYGISGLAVALNHLNQNHQENFDQVNDLRSYFKQQLVDHFADIRFNGNQEENYLPHILSVSFPPSDKVEMLMFNLDINGIAASSGSACSSGIESDSHVLQAIRHEPDRAAIRFSFSPWTTREDIDYVVEKLNGLTPSK